jgi:uncharacterized coiled-coil DUF342 family protein
MKIKRFQQFEKNYTNSDYVSDAQVDDILDRTKGKNLTDIEKNRMSLYSKGDDEISELLEELVNSVNTHFDLSKDIKEKVEKFKNQNKENINMLDLLKMFNEMKKLADDANNDIMEISDKLSKYGIDIKDDRVEKYIKKYNSDFQGFAK